VSRASSVATPIALRSSVLTVEQLAERWAVNRKTVFGMIARGELPVMRVGRLIRVPLAVIERLEQAGAGQEK
jgi:excisionase family DNA binding protein